MEETGANTSIIKGFIERVKSLGDIEKALDDDRIPDFVKQFNLNTMRATYKPTPYVAGQFFYGR